MSNNEYSRCDERIPSSSPFFGDIDPQTGHRRVNAPNRLDVEIVLINASAYVLKAFGLLGLDDEGDGDEAAAGMMIMTMSLLLS